MTTLRPERLDVYYGDALVGFVHDSAPLAFEYAPGWLYGPQRMALAAIPRQDGRQATREVQAFFENLLPEGELRDYLATQRKASTLFSLLLEVAGDTAGGFVLVAHGQTPAAPRYEATSWEAIAATLAKRSASAFRDCPEGPPRPATSSSPTSDASPRCGTPRPTRRS